METNDSDGSKRKRKAQAKLGAHSLHAQYNSRQITAEARKAFLASFEDKVDPERKLPPDERARRAKHALTAHMIRLSIRSAEERNGGGQDIIGFKGK